MTDRIYTPLIFEIICKKDLKNEMQLGLENDKIISNYNKENGASGVK